MRVSGKGVKKNNSQLLLEKTMSDKRDCLEVLVTKSIGPSEDTHKEDHRSVTL